jgi:hypothetical protein
MSAESTFGKRRRRRPLPMIRPWQHRQRSSSPNWMISSTRRTISTDVDDVGHRRHGAPRATPFLYPTRESRLTLAAWTQPRRLTPPRAPPATTDGTPLTVDAASPVASQPRRHFLLARRPHRCLAPGAGQRRAVQNQRRSCPSCFRFVHAGPAVVARQAEGTGWISRREFCKPGRRCSSA